MAPDRLTFAFEEGRHEGPLVLGGKGAWLAEMTSMGMPVPPGFIIGCRCGREYLERGALPARLPAELDDHLARLERSSGRRLGATRAPLLVSVRSGAPVSMPGMMDTILNVGLNEDVVRALAAEAGDEEFAWSCFARLLESFARTVRGLSAGSVEEALIDAPGGALERSRALLRLIDARSSRPFPSDPRAQLLEALEAVFRSSESTRARAYRRHAAIEEGLGTAAVVQRMVFGNRATDSGSGVAFSRDPATGAPGAYGEFLFGAQGEDVVSGEADPDTLAQLAARLPGVHAQLERVLATLERHARDLCEVEFTVELGKLWVLQTRVAQRSGRAAVRVAVAMVDEGLIDVSEALQRVSSEQLEQAAAPGFVRPPTDAERLATGLPGSPGAATGRAVFDSSRALALDAEADEAVILVRPTTSPADVEGMITAAGIVTGRGGRTSHAAVVARGMGRPAVCAVGDVHVAPDARSATVNGRMLVEGEMLSVDGDRGAVARGVLPLAPATGGAELRRLRAWRHRAAAHD